MSELYHHGVQGMKWGVRRYQNADGSLTAAGKRRRAKAESAQKKETKEKAKAAKKAEKAKKASYATKRKNDVKNRADLTDEELKKKIERIKMEKELRELTDKELSSGSSKARSILSSVGEQTFKNVATKAATGTALYLAALAISGEEMNNKDFAAAIYGGGSGNNPFAAANTNKDSNKS